jgi:hypothetical protein
VYSGYLGGVACAPAHTNPVSWGSPETGSWSLEGGPGLQRLMFVGLPIPCDGGDGVVRSTAWDHTHPTTTPPAVLAPSSREGTPLGMATRPLGARRSDHKQGVGRV